MATLNNQMVPLSFPISNHGSMGIPSPKRPRKKKSHTRQPGAQNPQPGPLPTGPVLKPPTVVSTLTVKPPGQPGQPLALAMFSWGKTMVLGVKLCKTDHFLGKPSWFVHIFSLPQGRNGVDKKKV